MKILTYPDRNTQAKALAQTVADQLQVAITQHGIARLALSGGTTPQQFLHELNPAPLPWESVRLTLTDERQVERDHPRSNLRFVLECLPNASKRAQILPLYTGDTDYTTLAQILTQHLLPLDVCVLGMGDDGHFASLFPCSPNLAQALDAHNPTPVMPIQPPAQEARVSLTLSALLTATHLHLLIQGTNKRQVLANAHDSTLPIATLLAQAGERLVIHYAD